MKNITLIFVGFFCITAFLNAQNVDVKTYFEGQFVGGLAVDGDIIWVGVDNSLVKMDKTTGETISWTLPISNEYNYTERYASSISLSNSGVAWIISPNGVGGYGLIGNYILIFDGVSIWTEIPWPNLFFANLIIDQKDYVWVSDVMGLHKFDGFGWIDYLPGNYFTTTFAVDSQNNKWLFLADIPMDPGPSYLAKFDGTQFGMHDYDYFDTNGSIWSIDVSPTGKVWMGASTNGLITFDGTDWEVYDTSNSEIPPNAVQNVTVEQTNIIWLSTSSGLTRFDGVNWETFNKENSILPSKTINSILIEENGTKWVGTDKGLTSFTGNTLNTFKEQYSGVQFNLFPNPANDFVTLKMPLDFIGSTIEVFNIQGKVMKSVRMTNNNYKMDTSDLASGMYFIRLQTRNGMAIKKFVKQN